MLNQISQACEFRGKLTHKYTHIKDESVCESKKAAPKLCSPLTGTAKPQTNFFP